MYDNSTTIPEAACAVMSTPVVTSDQASTVGLALCLMHRHNLSRLPVVDDAGRLCGMITYGDIRRFKARHVMRQHVSLMDDPTPYLTVREVMSEPPIAISTETSLLEACDLMFEHKVSALPVVNAKGVVIGIVTEQDLPILLHDRKDSLTTIHRSISKQELPTAIIEEFTT